MRGTFRHVIAGAVAIVGLSMAVATPLLAQGYSLNGARLGTVRDITLTIPPAGGSAQAVALLRLNFSGGNGANCTTGSLADYWGPNNTHAPVGVSAGYSSSPMGLPSNSTRTVAINVNSSAVPTARQFTIVVPRGSCQGSNQTSTINLTLVKAPPPPQPAAGDVRRSRQP